MHFQQYDLDVMKENVHDYGVDALLTPDGLLKLIADLEEARKERDEAREQVRIMGEAMDRACGF